MLPGLNDWPAPIATHDVALREVASFLYLADIIERFWALLSSSKTKKKNYVTVWNDKNEPDLKYELSLDYSSLDHKTPINRDI